MENYTILQPFRYLSCYVTVRYLQLLFTPSWYQILVEICTVLQRPRYFWAFQKNLGLVPWKYHFSHCCNVSTAMLFELSDSGLQLQLKIFLDRWSVLGHSTTGLVRPGLPNCMWLLLCQAINNHWALWREAWNEWIQWTKICKCPLSYITPKSREFSHLWGVIKVARVTLLPLI